MDKLLELIEERPWYNRRGKAAKFSHVNEDWAGTGAELLVFGDAWTFWPDELEKKTSKLTADVPDHYVQCDNCPIHVESDNYFSRFTDEQVFCSRQCLSDWLDENTKPESDGSIRDEGTQLY